MSEGFFIGLGDKTSCGGEVLDGDPRINLYGLLHACEGDRVTCGVNGKTYRIEGGISHMKSHGRLMAGTLDSLSSCPCKATLTPSVYTARYVKQPSAAQPMRRTAEATPTSAPRPTPQPSSFTLSTGSRRKVALAAALAAGAALTLLDQPYAALDLPSRRCITRCLLDCASQAERIYVMADYEAPEGVPLIQVIDLNRLLQG